MAILQSLQYEDVEWRAPWIIPDEILYRCEDFDWVPLLRIWGAVGYVYLLELRQYRSRQFIPVTQGLAQCEFLYNGDNYKKKAEENLDSLKIDYKKLHLSIRTTGLGKTSEKWQQEIKEERIRANQWEKKFQDARI
ncbi:hypothetical protein PVK06_040234 [Gossypium arboreum]|uniref:DUF7745 domain-containing protein n=1 Tax=Gossypium arboreum TaxID=29729 RepID=A0ABR0N4Y7_GOSAR|nr:hypothetical protein PVK06_040234 [Gossypium arboreum]